MTAWKQAVAQAFNRADDYDAAARIQAVVATRLAARIAGEALVSHPRTLEIGCGTGLLTQALRDSVAVGPMLATDIAPAMAARCRARLPHEPDLRFAVMDAERPCLAPGHLAPGQSAPGFDLIAGNLAAQWFEDLPGTFAGLAALLAPGGLLALTTLTDGTFREWREAHALHGLAPATPVYPDAVALRELRIAGCTSLVSVESYAESHRDGRAFLKALKAIGAGTPALPAGALSAGSLRSVLRSFEVGGSCVTYAIATCLYRRVSS